MRSRSSTPWLRPAAASSRSPTSSTTTSPRAGSSAASTTATGPTPAPSRPCSVPRGWPTMTTTPAGLPARSSARSADRAGSDATASRLGAGARILVTGGAGFIGSAYVRDVLGRDDGTRITVLDKLTYAGNRANLAAVEADDEQARRLRFVHGDIADPSTVGPLVADADAVVNVAAETHVDRSILDPEAFLRTGVIGVHVLLEAIRRQPRPVRFLQVSTDEVYGSVEE